MNLEVSFPKYSMCIGGNPDSFLARRLEQLRFHTLHQTKKLLPLFLRVTKLLAMHLVVIVFKSNVCSPLSKIIA